VASFPVMILAGGPAAAMKLHNLMNIFSYLRIMGIGVASVALAYTANRIVSLVPWPALGILAGVTLHAINLAFCILSPTIQALRLHYVEFFENFFDGGGRAYKPFKIAA
jgi:V/A-type H+-transporting ATPase subunit I